MFCYINAIETRKHKLFSVKCCVNARWLQWCCWQGRKLDEESVLSPEIGVIATLKSVSSPLAPTHPHSSITFQKEVQKLFLVPTTYIPSRIHTRSEFLFCYCKWEFRPYWFQAFFFFFSSPFLLSETLLSWNGPQIFSFPAPRQWMVLGSGTSLISSYKAREWIPRH